MSTKAAQKKRSTSRKSKKAKSYSHVHISIFFLLATTLTTGVIGCALAWFLLLEIPDIRTVNDYRPQVATLVLDRNGKQIDQICNQYRILTPIKSMPPLLPKAFVAAEDARFWSHPGLDIWSIFRAAVNNIRSGRRGQGGSTITQQVTRSLMLTREKSYIRKITEAILAYRLTKMLTKEEILYIYLNEIYLGEGAYGVAAASRVYFNKKVSQLTLNEIVILAGLPQAPSTYSPLRHPQAAKKRQRYVLNRMAEDNLISANRARSTYKKSLVYTQKNQLTTSSGYFASHVRNQLFKKFDSNQIFKDGLVVWTTLDSRLQNAAAKAIEQGTIDVATRQHRKTAPQGALIAIDAPTGRIRAMVGGTNFNNSPYNRAVDARRQPGSSFKPLIYAAAFDKNISPYDQISDSPFSIRNSDGSTWAPKNYDKKYLGMTSIGDGLIYSRNIIAIKLLQKVGMKTVTKLAKNSGITSKLQKDLTLALGTTPVSLLEMTGAYSSFINKGKFVKPVCITKVKTKNGKMFNWPQPQPKQVISSNSAGITHSLLTRAVSDGTGKKAAGVKSAAGKTGTSSNNTDAWFIGTSGRLLVGAWLGYDKNKTLGKNETGGQAAAPVWKNFIKMTGK